MSPSKRFLSKALFLPIVVGMIVAEVRGDVLVSNLSRPYRATTPIGNPAYWAAQSFSYSGGGPVQLDSLQAGIRDGLGAPDVVAELRSATGTGELDNSAAGLIATFTAPDLSGPPAPRTFLPDSFVTLLPDTLYWFALGTTNSGTFGWDYAADNMSSGFGSLGNYSDSTDAGATWTVGGNEFPYFIQVNSSVPEPSASVVIAVVFGAILSLRRRRTT